MFLFFLVYVTHTHLVLLSFVATRLCHEQGRWNVNGPCRESGRIGWTTRPDGGRHSTNGTAKTRVVFGIRITRIGNVAVEKRPIQFIHVYKITGTTTFSLFYWWVTFIQMNLVAEMLLPASRIFTKSPWPPWFLTRKLYSVTNIFWTTETPNRPFSWSQRPADFQVA